MRDLGWKTDSERKVLTTPIFGISEMERTSHDGRHGKFVRMDSPDWVVAIPWFRRSDGVPCFVMEEQWRHGPGRITREFPAGLVEKGESGEEAAKRELMEETGMTGAINIDPAIVDAKYLINLDSENEGEIAVGCAGGIEVSASCRAKADKAEGIPLKVSVSGLLGGHSGSEIHLERGNAIKILARYLNRLPSFQIASFTGGTLHNVIPFSAEAVITVPDRDVALSIAGNLRKELENEFRESDPGLKFEVKDTEMPQAALKRKKSQKIADAMFCLPHGVRSRIPSMLDTVETSVNLATARLEEGRFTVLFSLRSMIDSKKMALVEEIQTLLEGYGFSSKVSGGSPAWEKSDGSRFAQEFIKLYRKITGRKPEIRVLHGILECGILAARIPGLSAISLGPDVKDVHSVNETLSIASSERLADCVMKMLPLLK